MNKVRWHKLFFFFPRSKLFVLLLLHIAECHPPTLHLTRTLKLPPKGRKIMVHSHRWLPEACNQLATPRMLATCFISPTMPLHQPWLDRWSKMSHFTYLHISGQHQTWLWFLDGRGEMSRDAPIPACPTLQSHKFVTFRARATMEITDGLFVITCYANPNATVLIGANWLTLACVSGSDK